MQDDSYFSEFRCGPPTGAWARGSMGGSAGMPLRRRHAGEKLEMTAGLRMAGRLFYCRAERTLAGKAPGWLVRNGLMSRPPRRV